VVVESAVPGVAGVAAVFSESASAADFDCSGFDCCVDFFSPGVSTGRSALEMEMVLSVGRAARAALEMEIV
jgi:hypothetical protein